jgi:hypothetical protein
MALGSQKSAENTRFEEYPEEGTSVKKLEPKALDLSSPDDTLLSIEK